MSYRSKKDFDARRDALEYDRGSSRLSKNYHDNPLSASNYDKSYFDLLEDDDEKSNRPRNLSRSRANGKAKGQEMPTMKKSEIHHGYGHSNRNSRSSSSGNMKNFQEFREQRHVLEKNMNWKPAKFGDAVTPHELTATTISQINKLSLSDAQIANVISVRSNSAEWLKQNGLEASGLLFNDIYQLGKVRRPIGKANKSQLLQQHIQFKTSDLHNFGMKLNQKVELCTNRIKYLLRGSQRLFGVISGTNIAILLDASNQALSHARQEIVKQNLLHLVDEQLQDRQSLFAISYGRQAEKLWPLPVHTSSKKIHELKCWSSALVPSGGSNLLPVLRRTLLVKSIDCILIIHGSNIPVVSSSFISFVEQAVAGKKVHLHAVAFDMSHANSKEVLKSMASATGGIYHCYDSNKEEEIYTGTDIKLLLGEIAKAKVILKQMYDMRQGSLGTALVSLIDGISQEVADLPALKVMPQPAGHSLPLTLEMPKFQASTSQIWLLKHGLKGKNLDLYQVLAPNAFSFREGFIPVIRKTVTSQVHERAMTQLSWNDGTVKNVHVDVSQLYEYQKRLGSIVKILEKRVDWLSCGSRKVLPTISERNVVFVIDTCIVCAPYIIYIQNCMRLVMEQQMANKDNFNVISMGSNVCKWQETMVKSNPGNLQNAWKWILELKLGGTRNLMGALREVFENEEERNQPIELQGVYLLICGTPDQDENILANFIEENCAGKTTHFNISFFSIDDADYVDDASVPGRFASIKNSADCIRNLAHAGHGRFHWCRENGIIESDDISLVAAEIEKALNFSIKCSLLVDSVKKKLKKQNNVNEELEATVIEEPEFIQIVQPKHTLLSQQRMLAGENENEVLKTSHLMPSSAFSAESKTTQKQIKKSSRYAQSFFFTGQKKTDIGMIFTKYIPGKNMQMQLHSGTSFKPEDATSLCSTKQWMKSYSLSKLKLDLEKMISKKTATNPEKNRKILQKNIQGKILRELYPMINHKGTMRYLQLQSSDIERLHRDINDMKEIYLERLHWLLTGSRQVFGTLIEKRLCILIDTSGSVVPYIDELKQYLVRLVWDQIYANRIRFNLVGFSDNVQPWRERVVEPTEENCREAVAWINEMQAEGSTCTLEALQYAFSQENIEGVYLLTDGKPNSSMAAIIRQVQQNDRKFRVHSISFNCDDSSANNFLRTLASMTDGRYHQWTSRPDSIMMLVNESLLTECSLDELPGLDGDDLKQLVTEFSKTKIYLKSLDDFRNIQSIHQEKLSSGIHRSNPHQCRFPVNDQI